MTLPLLVPPIQPYAVNGSVLLTQPAVATAPRSAAQQLFAGARFTLLFSNADANTQAILASGQIVSLQFALSSGNVTTAQVLLESTLTGTVFQVDCVLLATQVIYQWIVQVQAA